MNRSRVRRVYLIRSSKRCVSETSPRFTRDDELLVYRVGKTLYETRRIDDGLYAQAVQAFGEPAVVELTGVFGYYALVAMTLNVFSVAFKVQDRVQDADVH
ncbi:hypothetical protein [Pseudomonas sp. S2_D10]